MPTGSAATVDNLVQQMTASGTVLKGWDVVVNLDEDLANDLIAAQLGQALSTTWLTMSITFCQVFPNPSPHSSGQSRIAAYTRVQVTLSMPTLRVVAHNENVVLIHSQATGKTGTASALVGDTFDPLKDARPDDPGLQWDYELATAVDFDAHVPITQVQGTRRDGGLTTNLVLNFPAGSFQSPLIARAKDPGELQAQIKTWFAGNQSALVLFSINSGVLQQLPQMAPTAFALNTLITNAGKNLLQLFIVTNGAMPLDKTINVNEPLPDGYDLTVFVNQRVAASTGPSLYVQAGLFMAATLSFPGQTSLALGPQFSPSDLLILGNLTVQTARVEPSPSNPSNPGRTSMLNIQKTRQIPYNNSQFTAYGDDVDANTWYIVPTPAWATTSDGQARFALVQYDGKNGSISGYCNFSVVLQVPPAQVKALKDAIPGAVLGQFDWETAAAQFTYTVSGASTTIHATPTRFGNQEVCFAVTLPDQPSVLAFQNAFSPSGSAGGTFSVSYDLAAHTRLPAVTVVTTFNSATAYRYQVEQRTAIEQRYHTDTWGNTTSEPVVVYLGEFVTELLTQTQAGTVVVTPGASLTPELLSMVQDWAQKQLAADTAQAISTTLAMMRNRTTNFTLNEVSSFTNTLTSTNVVPWYFTTEASLLPLDQITWASRFSRVSQQRLLVTFNQTTNLGALKVKSVTITLKYPSLAQDVSHTFLGSPVMLAPSTAADSVWAIDVDGDVSTGVFNPSFQYKYEVVYATPPDGVQPPNLVTDWIKSSAETINLTAANLGLMPVTFDAGNLNWTTGKIKNVQVTWAWLPSDTARKQFEAFQLDATTSSLSRTLRSAAPSSDIRFTYNLTFNLTDGTSFSALNLLGDTQHVFIRNPIQPATFSVFLAVGSTVKTALLRATFDDEKNKINTSHSWRVNGTTANPVDNAVLADWTFDTVCANLNACTVVFSGVLIDTANKQTKIPDTIVTGNNSAVVISDTQKYACALVNGALVPFVNAGATAGIYEVDAQVSVDAPPSTGLWTNSSTLTFNADSETTQYFSQLMDIGTNPIFYYQYTYTDTKGAQSKTPAMPASTTLTSLPPIPTSSSPAGVADARMVHAPRAMKAPTDAVTQRLLARHNEYVKEETAREHAHQHPKPRSAT
jgi:hypothetical protein